MCKYAPYLSTYIARGSHWLYLGCCKRKHAQDAAALFLWDKERTLIGAPCACSSLYLYSIGPRYFEALSQFTFAQMKRDIIRFVHTARESFKMKQGTLQKTAVSF